MKDFSRLIFSLGNLSANSINQRLNGRCDPPSMENFPTKNILSIKTSLFKKHVNYIFLILYLKEEESFNVKVFQNSISWL